MAWLLYVIVPADGTIGSLPMGHIALMVLVCSAVTAAVSCSAKTTVFETETDKRTVMRQRCFMKRLLHWVSQ